MSGLRRVVLALWALVGATEAFGSIKSAKSTRLFSSDPSNEGGQQQGRLERIEFKIYPDGRVEETVLGVQGKDCLEITKTINEKLGNVISTTPTEEMYQEEIKVDQTLYNNNNEAGGSDWEGSSSW